VFDFSPPEIAPMICRNRKAMAILLGGFVILLTTSVLIFSSCGYRVRGSVGTLPAKAQSLGIPTFRNSTTQYKIEQLISRAVVKEFSARTRSTINSSSSGVDLVLLGEIRDVSFVPVTFGTQEERSQTTASTFLVTVQLSVQLVRTSDSLTIWKNDDFLFRERYVMNSNVRDFFSEENPALERLAQSFAASLASSILNRAKP
jgi:outer membrane lipopolysaccharide assembly protein LptE/RlpB